VARRAVQVLEERSQRAPDGGSGGLNLIVTGDREAFAEAMGRLGFSRQLEQEAAR
jgi:hypothetical protein